MTAMSDIEAQPVSTMARINQFLDQFVLPWPVKYLTNRITILATLCLLVPLIAFATNQVLVLLANSYLNVMSVVVSSTVLLYSTISDARDKAAAKRREEIAAEHEKMVQARADEDHARIEAINTHIDEIHQEVLEHITTSLDTIQKLLIDRMEQMQVEDHQHIIETNTNVLASIEAHKEELEDMRKVLNALRPDEPPSKDAPSTSD
ncbi:MAG TPA: hypothetical protein VHD90_18065 [Phototrophicaceae bacterium]|nr:hypothetical protein [Phototrophicaceae bacterium]